MSSARTLVVLAALAVGGCLEPTGADVGHVRRGPCSLAVIREVGPVVDPQRIRLTPPYRVPLEPIDGAARIDYAGARWRSFTTTVVDPDGFVTPSSAAASMQWSETEAPMDHLMLLSRRGTHRITFEDSVAGCTHELTIEVF